MEAKNLFMIEHEHEHEQWIYECIAIIKYPKLLLKSVSVLAKMYRYS